MTNRSQGLILFAVLVLSAVEGCAGTAQSMAPADLLSVTAPTDAPANLPFRHVSTAAATSAPTPTNPASPTGTTAPPGASTPAPGPESDYPLALNNTWIYESTRYEGFNPQQIMTATQIITETVVEVKTDASYFAARISRETSADTPVIVPKDMGSMLRPAESSTYWLVVQDNRIYRLEGNPDLSNFDGTDSLEFVLPLKPGAAWTLYPPRLPNDPAPSGGITRQTSTTGPVQVPAGQFDNCYLMKDDWVDLTVQNWFCPGVGWVDLKSDHNGTPSGSRLVLLAYHFRNPTSTLGSGAANGVEPAPEARAALESFMQARIARDEVGELSLLTDRLRIEVTQGLPVDVPFAQVSNPCWYRFQIVTFTQPGATLAQARVRVYEHQ